MNDVETKIANKDGYKKTNLGLIPVDWKMKPIKAIGKVITGSTPSTKEESYYGGEYLFATPADLNSVKYVEKTEKKLTKSGFETGRLIPEKSVLFVSIGSTIGKTGIASSDLITNQQINSIKTNKLCSDEYLFYQLTHLSERIKLLAGEQAVPILNKSNFESIRIPIPSVREQTKVAQIISTWDEAISKTEKLIKAKKRYKKGLMQRLLSGRVRFPEFEGEDWVEVKLKKFFKPFSDKNKDNEDLPILSCSKVHGITLQSNIFDKRVASKDIKRYKIIERDDLIYDPMLLWDASIGFLKEVKRGVISPAYNTFKFKENSGYRPFFEHLFDTHYMRYNYKAISQGTNRRRRKAPAQAFLNIDINVPKSVEEQKKIATVLGTLSEEIELLKEEVALYQKQKKGLMQQLLTGKVRVN